MVADIANNKILDFDKITELQAKKALTYLAYMQDRAEALKAQQQLINSKK